MFIRGGLSDPRLRFPNMGCGHPDVRCGLPDMRCGFPDVRGGLPDVRGGLPDMRCGLPDVQGYHWIEANWSGEQPDLPSCHPLYVS